MAVLSITTYGSRSALRQHVVRLLLAVLCLVPGLAPLPGATLQSLSMDEMAAKATAIVRGRITGSYASMQGTTIFTHYQADVLERWKGAGQGQVDVALPGGMAAGLRQSFSGIPRLVAGKEYVLFLWTGKSGLTQLIGLSQGLFDVSKDASGELTAARSAISGAMLDASGRAVQDQPLQMRLVDMKSRVLKALSK